MSYSKLQAVPELHHVELNPDGKRTIVLVHGGFSSHREWYMVQEHLPDYHLLIPDLPGHGRDSSRWIRPFTFETSAALIADLIARRAKGGKAAVVGLSLGGYTSLKLASMFPDRVQEVFTTGCGMRWDNWRCGRWLSWILFGLAVPSIFLPLIWAPFGFFTWRQRKQGIFPPHGLLQDQRAAAGVRLGLELARAAVYTFDASVLRRVRSKTLIIAASGDDSPEAAKEMAVELRQGNPVSRAAEVKGRHHVWDMEDPAAFAAGIIAWVEGRALPSLYEAL